MSLDTKRLDHPLEPTLYFTSSDLEDVVPHEDDPVMIYVVTVARKVHKVLVDQRISADVMFGGTFTNLQLSPDQLRPYDGCLVDFVGDQVEVRGYVELRTTFSDESAARTITIMYIVVNVSFAYNLLLGRPSLNRLGNVMLIKKANEKWRMCVNFTYLNKAYPKDSYPLLSIDSLVDNASGCRLLSFLDAFSGYNQSGMHPKDESKTTFMTEVANYCYKVMPFGLKNASTTYQRLMDRIPAPMLERNVQVYVDDMIVMSERKDQHVVDLEELLTTITKYNLKLNLDKCVFEVEARKFLGFLLTERDIEANPDKCTTIIGMRSPTNTREVQQLTGHRTAISRFLSASGDKGYH